MAIAYSREDGGAPVLTYGATVNLWWNAIKTILKACLVSGYGVKPGAGWELISEGTNHLVLRNGSRSGYLGMRYDAPTTSFVVTVSATYEGVVSDTLTGAGARSGLAANSSIPQRVRPSNMAYSASASCWHIVADEKSFAMSAAGSSSLRNMDMNLDNICTSFYAGEDAAGNFIAVGGTNSTNSSVNDSFYSAGFTTLRDPETGLLVSANAISVEMNVSNPNRSINELPLVSGLSLMPVIWGKRNAAPTVRLRGVVIPSVGYMHYPAFAAKGWGMPGTLNSRNYNTPLDLGDGHPYFLFGGTYFATTMLLTTNPEFW